MGFCGSRGAQRYFFNVRTDVQDVGNDRLGLGLDLIWGPGLVYCAPFR